MRWRSRPRPFARIFAAIVFPVPLGPEKGALISRPSDQRSWERGLATRPTPELENALAWRRNFVLQRDDLRHDPSVPLWTRQAALIRAELDRRKDR